MITADIGATRMGHRVRPVVVITIAVPGQGSAKVEMSDPDDVEFLIKKLQLVNDELRRRKAKGGGLSDSI